MEKQWAHLILKTMSMRIRSSLADGENQFQVKRPKKRFRRTTIRRAGKKVKEWESIRRILKPRFMAVGITTCELKFEGCWRDNGLGFCHTKKRLNCSPTDLWIVCLGCNSCHQKIEILSESEMGAKVLAVIAARLIQP